MNRVMWLFMIVAGLSLPAGAQIATLTASGNITLSAAGDVSGTVAATLAGYGSGTLSITGPLRANTFTLDFGGGDVLRGTVSDLSVLFNVRTSNGNGVFNPVSTA